MRTTECPPSEEREREGGGDGEGGSTGKFHLLNRNKNFSRHISTVV